MQFFCNLDTSNVFKRISYKIPDNLKDCELVIVHYTDFDYTCNRWTSRSRDISKKNSKMLQFDICHAYLMEPKDYLQFKQRLESNSESFSFLAYRLCGDTWKSTVDHINKSDIWFVESSNTIEE